MARAANIAYFALPFIVSGVLAWLTVANPYLVWLNYALWLSIMLGFFNFANFVYLYRRSRAEYRTLMTGRAGEHRIAVLITSYNEDPELVEGTIRSAVAALKGRGDVFLLDDSTDQEKARELGEFCRAHGIGYMHRTNRRGFKAGAINDAIKALGDKYDLVAIFDADQRPTDEFFDAVLPYFDDESVGFVQVPQTYTELRSGIAESALYQQQPFLRVIMQGRHARSAFSLGSGTVYRLSALKEAGLLDESSITEDVATSVRIHELGYRSIYVDHPLIWYGEPPPDASAYLSQQSRWSLGTFQILGKLLRSNLPFPLFFDYISGWFYWMEAGPLTMAQMLAPSVYLVLRAPVIRVNVLLYMLAYFPFVVFSLSFFFAVMRGRSYGLKGFFYHQFAEYLEFFTITLSFVAWALRRRVPFKVTPKGRARTSYRALAGPAAFLVLLYAAVVAGVMWMRSPGAPELALIVNVFWAAYHALFLSGGLALALWRGGRPEERLTEEVRE